MSELDARLQAFIEDGRDSDHQGGEHRFEQLALELFADQYERNAAYRRFCRSRRAEPGSLRSWTEIPAVPLRAFKELTLTCDPPEAAAAVFMTSGSTDARRRGRNHHPHLRLYDASLRVNFREWFLPDRDKLRLLVLNPRPHEQPRSSLAYFMGRVVDFYGAPGSDFFLDDSGLQLDRLTTELRRAEETGEPVALLGTSFAYVHLLDALDAAGLAFRLPEKSRLLDTGGFKGRSREVSPTELLGLFEERLGIPRPFSVNYYGMTEISTQYYDRSLRGLLDGRPAEPRYKTVPHWARVQVIDPETRQPVAPGERGLIVHYDLANRGSCLAVMAEDVGHVVAPANPTNDDPGGFVLIGRAEGAEARGCSITLDELLAANAGAR
jgi:hypothetical protein